MHRIASFLVRWHTPLFLACLLGAMAAWPFSQNISFDRSVSSLFPPEHPQLLTYYETAADFGVDASCLAVYSDEELLTADGMQRLARLGARFRKVDGIARVTSLADMPRPKDPNLPNRLLRILIQSAGDGTLANLDADALFPRLPDWFREAKVDDKQLRNEILGCELYRNVFVGADGQTASLILTLESGVMGSGQFDETLRALREICAESKLKPAVVGAPVLISDVFEHLEQDSQTLTRISTVTMFLVILLLFRNIRWVVLPMLVVHVALIWTRSFMGVASVNLSIIGTMMTALVTVIGIATSIHLAVRYREQSGSIDSPPDALQSTLEKVGPAIFWTCATTGAGFGALAVSDVAPVKNFAFVMSFASLAVAAAAFLLVAGGVLIGRFGSVPRGAPGEAFLGAELNRMGENVGRHSFLAAGSLLACLGAAAWGVTRLEVETDFTRYFREDSQIFEGYRYVENKLGGAGSIQLTFPAPDDVTPATIKRLAECSESLREIDGVTKATGLSDLLDFFSDQMPKTRLAAFVSEDLQLDVKVRLLQALQPSALAQFWNRKQGRMLIELRIKEQVAATRKNAVIEAIKEKAQECLGRPVRVSGLTILLTHLVDSLLGDQRTAFAVSSLAIVLMTTAAFRSPLLGLAAFIPNLVPILAVLGLMGWIGLKINVATAMIGSISMGLVVDFSIHYVNRFLQERRLGFTVEEALGHTHQSTGKAMFFANIALTIGFLVLATSDFLPTVHFGLLVSIATVGGLIGNLVLLPVLLRLVVRDGR